MWLAIGRNKIECSYNQITVNDNFKLLKEIIEDFEDEYDFEYYEIENFDKIDELEKRCDGSPYVAISEDLDDIVYYIGQLEYNYSGDCTCESANNLVWNDAYYFNYLCEIIELILEKIKYTEKIDIVLYDKESLDNWFSEIALYKDWNYDGFRLEGRVPLESHIFNDYGSKGKENFV